MTKQELIEKLNKVMQPVEGRLRDAENWHSEADSLLLEFINDKDIEEAYEKIDKWYA